MPHLAEEQRVIRGKISSGPLIIDAEVEKVSRSGGTGWLTVDIAQLNDSPGEVNRNIFLGRISYA